MSVTIASTHTATDRNTNTITLTATPPSASGTVAFLFVSIVRSTNTIAIDSVTCSKSGGGTENMAALHYETLTYVTNRWFAWGLYQLTDPVDALGSGEHVFTVTASANCIMALTLIYVTGVTEVRTAEYSNAVASSLTLPVTNEFTPSLILAGGFQRINSNGSNQYDNTIATGDTTSLTKVLTGENQYSDLIAFSGYAPAVGIGTYDLGWQSNNTAAIAVTAVELVGEYDPAPLTLGAVAPTVILGDILIEDLTAALDLAASLGETSLGSIPPVQVIARGNLYFATNARNLTAILLATTGDKWTIATAAAATEQLGCSIVRRNGYITPR